MRRALAVAALAAATFASSALGFGWAKADLSTDRHVTVTFEHRVVVHGCYSKDGCILRWEQREEGGVWVIKRVWP